MPPKQKSARGRGKRSSPPRPLTTEQEEAMSSALIAKLLAEEAAGDGGEDHPYYAEYNNNGYGEYYDGKREVSDDEYVDGDEDYAPKPKSKKQAKVKKRSVKEASNDDSPVKTNGDAATNASTTTTTTTTDSGPPSAKKRRKEKELREGMNVGTYSEEEEKLFLEALELYGRDWQALARHIKTRDSNSIRSHAQKHFIKLYRDGLPLPDKVKESGAGYTLSGKELDPNSAAAKPYLLKAANGNGSDQTPVSQAGTEPKKEEPVTEEVKESTDMVVENGDVEKPEQKSPVKNGKITKEKVNKPAKAKVTKKKEELSSKSSESEEGNQNPKTPQSQTQPSQSEAIYDGDGRTEYSKSRLRRARSSINFAQLTADSYSDPLTMIKCEPFSGPPESGIAGCQPFSIVVHTNVVLAMDFHAHLMTTEIIGFLAGEWDSQEQKIKVKAAFPCRSLQTGQNHVNVEMDPASELEVRQRITELNMRVVGWYHSHPTFVPDPSLTDIQNQTNYQRLFRDAGAAVEPFIGAIVGPYDPHLPGSTSVINWFYVSTRSDERGHPKRLVYDQVEDASLPETEADELLKLAEQYRESPERVRFGDMWRQGESKLEKMLKSLGRRMPWVQRQMVEAKEREIEKPKEEKEEAEKPEGGAEEKIEATEAEATVDRFLERVERALRNW
ncbi:uncharacterized protein VTP21DRAFT_5385 [Calcarisporiella thermophila]|uniref:uncharacterized protein n=1 Tax=Calcarisporiella thermophila TaxID=911321 RepID=UPI003743C435